MKIMKFILSICPILLVMGFLTGCHTLQGAGQDVSQTGQTVTNVAAQATPDP